MDFTWDRQRCYAPTVAPRTSVASASLPRRVVSRIVAPRLPGNDLVALSLVQMPPDCPGLGRSVAAEQFSAAAPLHGCQRIRTSGAAMSAAAKSILVYSIYVFGLGMTLLLVPNISLPLFGLPEAHEVWIRVAGMTVIFLSIFYFIAARNEYRATFVASVPIRFAVVAFFAGFAAAGFTPWNILLFTPLDVLFAIWTWSALRQSPATA
jgi:hypothetical protein